MGDEVNRPLASRAHTAAVLVIMTGFSAWGAYNAGRMRAAGATRHLTLYLTTMAFEWLLTAFVLWGVRRAGAPAAAVLGRPWKTAPEIGRDLAVAALFWCGSLMALGILSKIFGITNQRESVRFLVPHGALEMALWVALSVTAGICEEAVFRGYLQNQLRAITGSAPVGIALSAALFGAGHIYQGYRAAILIACYGAMFGGLAHWRGSVRPGMMAHAWQDTVSGLLASVVRV